MLSDEEEFDEWYGPAERVAVQDGGISSDATESASEAGVDNEVADAAEEDVLDGIVW